MLSKFVANIKQNLVISGVIILFFVLGVNLFFYFFSAKTVSSEIVERQISVGDLLGLHENTLENRLKAYSMLSQIDPILSIPEQIVQINDIDKTISNISKLEKYNLISGTKHHLFPIDFFNRYFALIRKQSAYFDTPTLENARAYQDQLEQTILAYQKDLSEYEDILKEFFSDKMERKVVNAPGKYAISPALILSDIKIIEINIQKMESLVQERKKCLEQDITLCGFETGNPNIGVLSSRQNNDFSSQEIWTTVKNGCWNSTNGIVMLFQKTCEKSFGVCYLDPTIQDIVMYKSILPNEPYEKMLYEKGVRINPLNTTATYMCADNRYRGPLGNIDYYLEYIRKNPITSIEDESHLRDIAQIEKNILVSHGADSDKIKKITNEYFDYILANISKDSQTGQKILIRYRLLKGNLMNNYLTLNESWIHLMNYFETNIAADKQAKNSDAYLMLVRSNYSFNYLLFSPFVWQISGSPIFSIPDDSFSQKGAKKYTESEAIQTYGKDVIDNWNTLFFSLDKTDFYSKFRKNLGF